MSNQHETRSEAARLEELWSTEFGNDYVDRNRSGVGNRSPFWTELLREISVDRILEVGCNLGINLRALATQTAPEKLWGVDVNLKALAELRVALPGVNAVWSSARELPFRDRWFDLVYTTGVLIHQPDATLPLAMAELVRCSNRYVLCGEYYAETQTEIAYRGQRGALFKRDYGRVYLETFPELRLVKQGFLGRDQGWDDVTYWLFEKK